MLRSVLRSPLAQFFNEGLPERLHKSNTRKALEMNKYHKLTKCDLHRQVKAAWKAMGKPRPTGWMMPSLDQTCAGLEYGLEAAMDHADEIGSGKLARNLDLAERINRMVRGYFLTHRRGLP
ncbi:MAG TPA: hypothetical protein VIL84_09190 [Devosiaceae bacterium]